MIAALSAERVQCFDSKEDQSAPTREPDSPPPIKNQRDEPTDVGNHTTSHEEIRVMKPVAPRSRYYRVVVRDGVCFRIHPDISAICPDGSGVPYGDIIEVHRIHHMKVSYELHMYCIEIVTTTWFAGDETGSW